jgi:hypothetical protein
MSKKWPHPRIVGDKVMMPADLKRLHKYMLEVGHIGVISDEMREVAVCCDAHDSRRPRPTQPGATHCRGGGSYDVPGNDPISKAGLLVT